MRKAKETHLWFVKGDDEIQVESHCKELNKAILEVHWFWYPYIPFGKVTLLIYIDIS